MTDSDFAVVGGGVVGLCVAYGLLNKGKTVTLFDESDNALRASRGNFGLVWVQGKGVHLPAYARWTRQSASRWQDFAKSLASESNTNLNLQQRGGYSIHLDEASLAKQIAEYQSLKDQLNGDYPFEVLGHNAIKQEEPYIGPKVAGAILHHEDGHVNPLLLLRSLATVVRQRGANVHTGQPVVSVSVTDISQSSGNGYTITTANGQQHFSEKVVLCAGLGTRKLAQSLGFKAPIRAQRGQVLITEKMPPMINRPSGEIRQVNEGGIQIGASAEETGDDSETLDITARLAQNAIDQYPALASVSLLRSWAALRIMSPDGFPIYQQSHTCKGAFYATCHSGITLAAAHATLLPEWLCEEQSPQTANFDISAFSEDRFDV